MYPLDTRWVQRFSNFELVFLLLQDALTVESPSVLERARIIQFFELAFELDWKLLKDYEEAEGILVKSPREAIKQGFQMGIIDRGQDWIEALQDRNLTTHTYNEKTAIALEASIRNRYFPLLVGLYHVFKSKING